MATPTNAQWSKGTPATSTVTVANLVPGDNVIIGVRAVGKDSAGTVIHSDYATVSYTAPGTGVDGTNLIAIQNNTDIKLSGGAIYAQAPKSTSLPKNIGQLDLFTYPMTGSGVIFNQFGLASFNNGVREFALNGQTGEAFFLGRIEAGTMFIGPKVNPTKTKNGIYMNSKNYWYDTGEFSTGSEMITGIVTGPNASKPGPITNLVVAWQGQDIKITFNFDTSYLNQNTKIDNTHVNRVVIGFKNSAGTIRFVDGTLTSGTSHEFLVTYEFNKSLFGIFQNSFDQISVIAKDIYGNEGEAATASLAGYVSLVPVPLISTANINNGYSVTFNNYPSIASYPDFVDALIEEAISTSDTVAPTIGWNVSWEGTVSGSPAIKNVLSATYEKRWVRARYRKNDGGVTDPSTAYLVAPQNPVAAGLNTKQPGTPTVTNVAWSGDNISISYTATGDAELTSRFIIILTATDGTNTFQASFYKYPPGSLGADPLVISSDELYLQFGNYYSIYSGTIYQEFSETAIRSNGATFTTPTKVSLLTGVVPSLADVGIFSIPGAYAVTPSSLPVGAVGVNIYQSNTGPLGTYNFVKQIKYLSTVTLTDSSVHHVKVKYAGITGDESNFSAYTAVQSVNPTSATPTPFAPYISEIMPGDITETSITITLNSSDADNGLSDITKGYFVQYYPSDNMNDMIMNMVPSMGTVPAMYMIANLEPNKEYMITAAAYNDSNGLSEYTTPIAVTTDAAVISAPTNVQVAGIAYGIIVSWDPPSIGLTSLANYSVDVLVSDSASGTYTTLYSNQLTPSAVYSFPGLKGSKYYKAKVGSVDVYGNISSTKTLSSNYVYLNSLGGSSDFARPTTNPNTITLKEFAGALQINWNAIVNPDPVTYEVHISTNPSFSPNTTGSGTVTKALETPGLFGIVKTNPATGANLTYTTTTSTTTYYVTVVAKDIDGYSTGTYAYASGVVHQVQNNDIAADSIQANVIQAGTITGTQVSATNLLVGKTFSVGTGGTYAIKIDTTGSGVGSTPYKLYSGTGTYSDINTPFYLDSLGRFSLKAGLTFDGTSLIVAGEIRASSGYFTGSLKLNGAAGTMKIGKGVDGGSNNGIWLDAYNYWYETGSFKIGSSTSGATWNGTTFNVIGTIDATGGYFSGPVQINTTSNGALVIGASQTTGARIVANKNGIYAYDYGSASTASPSTWINLADAAHPITFQTNNAIIGGYTVDANKIQALSGTTYYGLSNLSTGSAFYAGGPDGGGTTSKFHVGIDGSVVARNLQLLGDGTTNSKLNIGAATVQTTATGNSGATTITVGSATGISAGMFVYATNITPNTTVKTIVGTTVTLSQVTTGAVAGNVSFIPAAVSTHIMPNGTIYTYSSVISGNSYFTSGYFTGNINMSTLGSIYSGTVINPGSAGNVSGTYPILGSGGGFILNKAGITFANTAGTFTTTLSGIDGTIKTNAATIGGWQVNNSQLYSPNSDIYLDANVGNSNTPPTTTSQPAIYAVKGSYYVGMTPITASNLSASDVVLWAGANPYSTRSSANFRVYGDGHVYIGGTGSQIDGGVTIGGVSKTLTEINTSAVNAATAASSAQTTANSAYTGLSNTLKKGGAIVANTSDNLTGIDMGGITLWAALGSTTTTTSAPTMGKRMIINYNGISAYSSNSDTDATFLIDSNGNATFAGTLKAAVGSFSGNITANGSISIGSSSSPNFFQTGYTRTGTGVTGAGFGAMAMESVRYAGWTSSQYPYIESMNSDLGLAYQSTYSQAFRFRNLRLNGSIFMSNSANGYDSDANVLITSAGNITTGGDNSVGGNLAVTGHISISGGYGITSHWSPLSDNIYDLGGWSLANSGVKLNVRWRQIYSNNSTIVTSDLRLKTSIRDSELGLNFINKLRPVTYKWIEGSKEEVFEEKQIEHVDGEGKVYKTEIVKVPKIIGKDLYGKDIIETISIPGKRRHAGFLAQEVKKALDELEIEDFGGWVTNDTEDPESIQSLRYEQFVAPLVKSVQELSDIVESLQQQLDNLNK